MFYTRPHATATWGTQAKDWEAGVDYRKLVTDRTERARQAITDAGLAAVICLNLTDGTLSPTWIVIANS